MACPGPSLRIPLGTPLTAPPLGTTASRLRPRLLRLAARPAFPSALVEDDAIAIGILVRPSVPIPERVVRLHWHVSKALESGNGSPEGLRVLQIEHEKDSRFRLETFTFGVFAAHKGRSFRLVRP